MTSGPDPGELPGFWGSMVFRHAPIPRKGSGKQQQQQQQIDTIVRLYTNMCSLVILFMIALYIKVRQTS